MSKFYKVIKENFLWDTGAILEKSKSDNGYKSIDEIYNKFENHNDEYISTSIIENCPEYFERVYPVNLVTKTVYKIKEQAKAMLEKAYT